MIRAKFRPAKSQLLRSYDRHEPQFFIQYLGFTDPIGSAASFVSADEDGHVLMMGDTWELPSDSMWATQGSEPALRILIKEGTTKAEALALLAKITAWIEKDEILG
jgi:hypothetical protein